MNLHQGDAIHIPFSGGCDQFVVVGQLLIRVTGKSGRAKVFGEGTESVRLMEEIHSPDVCAAYWDDAYDNDSDDDIPTVSGRNLRIDGKPVT